MLFRQLISPFGYVSAWIQRPPVWGFLVLLVVLSIWAAFLLGWFCGSLGELNWKPIDGAGLGFPCFFSPDRATKHRSALLSAVCAHVESIFSILC